MPDQCLTVWATPLAFCSSLASSMAPSKVGKLNIDENPESPSGFNIHSIPAVLLFKGGGVVETFVGVQPKERYE